MVEDFGKLVLRLGIGGLMLLRGAHKLMTGLDDVKAQLAPFNLPDAACYAVYLGEIAGPLLIVIGLFARFGALLVALETAALIALAAMAGAVSLTAGGAFSLEIEALYLTGALAILLVGPGRISIGGGRFH